MKKKDGPIGSGEQPRPARQSGLNGRLQTWRQSIWRRRWLSVVTAWLICVVGWAVIALWPTNFNASAVIYANLAQLRSSNAAADAPQQTPVAMLKAMLVTDESLEEIRNAVPLDEVRSRSLRGDITLRSTMPPVFVVAYEHEDPDTAQSVLDTLIERFEQHLSTASATSLEEAAALDRQIDDGERRLQAAESGLDTFRRENADHLDGADGRTAELAQLKRELVSLEDQVTATTAKRDEIATELAKTRDPAAEDDEAEQSRSPEDIEEEQKALEEELANLRERYADTHPYVVAVRDAIEALETGSDTGTPPDGGPTDTEAAPVDWEELEQRHGELIVEVSTLGSRLDNKRREIELLQALTRTTGSVESELAELEAEKEQLSAELAALQQRRVELGDGPRGEAKQGAFRLIKQPNLPADPIGPSRLVALAAVMIGGTGLGAAIAVFCNRWKGVFESAWQLRQRFDVGVLGTISEVMTPIEQKRLRHARLAFSLAYLALIGAFSGLVLAELTDRLAPWGESLRTQLLG